MKIRAFITHKLSEKYIDCQDRFSLNVENVSVAISDGMSESIFPHYWAEILSEAYSRGEYCPNEGIKELCTKWHDKVSRFIEEGKKNKTLHWRTEVNFLEGKSAGATLCGVKFDNSQKWRGHVLGDSCLITIDGDKIEEIFSSEDKPFDSYPDFYDSNPHNSGRGTVREISGEIKKGQCLLLVSDPFSEYLSLNKDSSKSLIREILSLETHDDFCNLVDNWRKNGMHNDDSTLVIIEWDHKKQFNKNNIDDINEYIRKESETLEELKTEVGIKNDAFESRVGKEIMNPDENKISLSNAYSAEIEEPANKEAIPQISISSKDNQRSSQSFCKQSTNDEQQAIMNFSEEISMVRASKEKERSIKAETSGNNQPAHPQTISQVETDFVNENKTNKPHSIDREYVIALIKNKKEELEKFFNVCRNHNKGKQKSPKIKIAPNDIYKRCLEIFNDLTSTIEQLNK